MSTAVSSADWAAKVLYYIVLFCSSIGDAKSREMCCAVLYCSGILSCSSLHSTAKVLQAPGTGLVLCSKPRAAEASSSDPYSSSAGSATATVAHHPSSGQQQQQQVSRLHVVMSHYAEDVAGVKVMEVGEGEDSCHHGV